MSPQRILVVRDFQRMAQGLTSNDRWRAVPPLDTPLGQFKIILGQPSDSAFAVDSRQTPDFEVVAAANALANFLVENADAVLAAVHANYLACCWDEGSMEGCEVPMGLAAAEIRQYLDDPTIAVDRNRDGHISAKIYFSPQWDQEHGLYFMVANGRIAQTEP